MGREFQTTAQETAKSSVENRPCPPVNEFPGVLGPTGGSRIFFRGGDFGNPSERALTGSGLTGE